MYVSDKFLVKTLDEVSVSTSVMEKILFLNISCGGKTCIVGTIYKHPISGDNLIPENINGLYNLTMSLKKYAQCYDRNYSYPEYFCAILSF